jgi:hypothetical protein
LVRAHRVPTALLICLVLLTIGALAPSDALAEGS